VELAVAELLASVFDLRAAARATGRRADLRHRVAHSGRPHL